MDPFLTVCTKNEGVTTHFASFVLVRLLFPQATFLKAFLLPKARSSSTPPLRFEFGARIRDFGTANHRLSCSLHRRLLLALTDDRRMTRARVVVALVY
eukprot:scaffold4820_cov67-Phaeocystis_antarctica.AAC.6